MRKKLLKFFLLMLLVSLPVGVHRAYLYVTQLPAEISIGTGPPGGRYRVLCEALANELKSKHGIQVHLVHTGGSLDNLELLQQGKVAFALYQPGTHHANNEAHSHTDQVTFVTNAYSEVTQLIVRKDLVVESPADLLGKRIAIGPGHSGDYAISQTLLVHLGVQGGEIEQLTLDYPEIKQGFVEGTVDVAIITAGIQAPIYRDLYSTGVCQLVSVPFSAALAHQSISIDEAELPAGLYQSHPEPIPAQDISTISSRAQLLANQNVSSALVEEVAIILNSEKFQKENQLTELFTAGHEFAIQQPEFPLHAGAIHFFEPDLRPILNSDFVESMEGLRSFIVSVLIAGFLTVRWLKKRRIRNQEHKLDHYIRLVLEMERRQLGLDQHHTANDTTQLQDLLDELTDLRQSALHEISAHELNEDRAADSFVQMCHALSDKINSKLSRQRIDRRFDELVTVLQKNVVQPAGVEQTQPEPKGSLKTN